MQLLKKYMKDYKSLINLPPFVDENRISERTKKGIEDILYFYSKFSNKQAKISGKNPNYYRVNDVYIVGSSAKENKIFSDLDVVLLAPKVKLEESMKLKKDISLYLFCNKPKQEALDVFVNGFLDDNSKKVTSQVKELLKKYNPKSNRK